MAEKKKTIQDAINDLESKFLNERDTWKNRIYDLSNMFESIQDIKELQIELHRTLMEVNDYKSYIQSLVVKKNSQIRKLKLGVVNDYSNQDVRYTAPEKQQLMEGSIRSHLQHYELLEVVLDYYEDLSKTLHGMTYQIQHRIKLEEFLVG